LTPVESAQYASGQITALAAANGITRLMGLIGIRRRRRSLIGHVSPVDFELQYSSQTAEVQLAA